MLSQTSRLRAVALATALVGAGCVVSFEGYTLGDSGAAGSAGAGGGAAGKGGATTGGSGGGGGATTGGASGVAGSSGAAASAGVAGNAGSTGGKAGAPGGSGGATAGGGGAGAGGAGGPVGGAGAGGAVGGAGGAGIGGSVAGAGAGGGVAGAGAGGSVGGAGAGGSAGGAGGTAGTGGAGGAGAGGDAGSGGAGAGGDAGSGGAGAGGDAGSGGAGAGGDAGSGGAGAGGGGGAGAGGGGGAGAGGSGGGSVCPTGLVGPTMVAASTAGGSVYCIDSTEVMQVHYKAFLDSGQATNTHAACSGNATFAPSTIDGGTGCDSTDFAPTTKATFPVRCVDWCDAEAFCRWTGKRLCGAVTGGTLPVGSFADASASQWFNACSAQGTQRYPYANVFSDGACNTLLGSSNAVAVKSYSSCEGSVPGLFDMSGNVAEWEDSCTGSTSPSDMCSVRGGDFNSTNNIAPSASCDSAKDGVTATASFKRRRDYAAQAIGFRCCFDP